MHELYFGYGSNLDLEDLNAFCERRGFGRDLLERVGPAFLPDRELAFTRNSPQRGGGVLDVVPRRGQRVDGHLFRIRDQAGWEALDAKEGAPRAYQRLETVALEPDGSAIPVRTYEVRPERREPFVPPAPRYLDIVRRARVALDLETAPLERAAADARDAADAGQLFVYGTLLRDESRHARLRRPGLTSIAPASCEGALSNLGDYPGLRRARGARVLGELVSYERGFGDLLAALDAIEGFEGFEPNTSSLFERRLLEVDVDGERLVAWVYTFESSSAAPIIASGDWRDRGR